MSEWIVREERLGDEASIRQVTRAAFAGHPHSEGTEPAIIDHLRLDGDLALSLVAEAASGIVGHVAFSPAILSNTHEGWYTLGPISVLPDRQGQGIGRALIEAGITHWRNAGAQGLVVVGDPDLYGRFGFRRGAPLHLPGPLGDYFQVLPFSSEVPETAVDFAPAFTSAGGEKR